MLEDSASISFKQGGRILIVTAVSKERDAIIQTLSNTTQIDIIAAGVGPVAAAVKTTQALAAQPYRMVISAGIGGGYPSKAEIGSIVLATEIVAADLGVETPDGFHFVDDLGFGSARLTVEQSLVHKIEQKLSVTGLDVHTGPILTVSTATGTEETAQDRIVRVPEAAAEAMEGFGAAAAALNFGVPYVEIRAISNKVGLRDRKAWKIDEAIDALAEACSILPEVLL